MEESKELQKLYGFMQAFIYTLIPQHYNLTLFISS